VTESRLPNYDELPVSPGQPPGSSWGLWGEGDRLGCLNLLTPQRVLAAFSGVRTGVTFSLNWDMELPDPPLFGRPRFTHTVKWLGNQTGHDDELSDWNTQSSSQWDGFRHIRHQWYGFYGGLADEDHGMQHWAQRGIVGRCVLVDMERHRAARGRPLQMDAPDPIEPDEVCAALEDQGTIVQVGDILLLRTGWTSWYRSLGPEQRASIGKVSSPGLRPGRATVRYLWDLHLAAIAADNPALEILPFGALATEDQLRAASEDPDMQVEVSAHRVLLPLLGMPIGEMFDLGGLAEACASDGHYEGLFVSAPLNLRGGVASPANAVVIR
jgi:kynurenine formamidase